MKYIAWNRNVKIATTANTIEEIEAKMAHRKNYLITNEDGEIVKGVENGKTLKGHALKEFEIEYTLG